MRSLLLPLSAALALSIGCGDTIVNVPTTPSPTTPAVVSSKIEFRVTGNPNSVRVRFSSPSEGLAQIVTTLPYSITFTTKEESLFLSLEATPISYSALIEYPFLSVQIVTNGTLFREATANEFLLHTLAVNGTWRR